MSFPDLPAALADLLAAVDAQQSVRSGDFETQSSDAMALHAARGRAHAALEAHRALKASPPCVTTQKIAELRTLLSRATPTPWTHWVENGLVVSGIVSKNTPGAIEHDKTGRTVCDCSDPDGEDIDQHDAALIAAGITALPALLNAVEMRRLSHEDSAAFTKALQEPDHG